MSQTKKSRAPQHWSPVHPAAAAIDIGATIHVAAVGPDHDEQPVRTFRTFTDDLNRLADWFTRCGIKTIAMESTGVYWIPVFEILEQRSRERHSYIVSQSWNNSRTGACCVLKTRRTSRCIGGP